MTTSRQITSLLEHALSGKEVAQIVHQSHLDRLLDKEPVFSAAELERAKRGLQSGQATIYNDWIEAARLIQCLAMETTITAQGIQIRLLRLLRVLDQYEDNFRIRVARELSPLMVTHEQAEQYFEVMERGRRDNMARQEISLFCATAYRAWQLAPEGLKDQVRAQPDFEEDENEYEILYRVAEEHCQALSEQATGDLACLVQAGKLRFSRNDEDVSHRILSRWWESCSTQDEVDAFESEAMCSLLELIDADLPEWTSWAKRNPADLAPAKYRRPVAVPYEPDALDLDEMGSYPEHGWNLLERWMQQYEMPELINAITEGSQRAERQVHRYVAGREIVRAFSAAIGVDFGSLLAAVEADLCDSIEEYNKHAERSTRPSVRSGALANFPREVPGDLRLQRLDLEELGPPNTLLAELKTRLEGGPSKNWDDAAMDVLRSSEKVGASRSAA